MNVPGFAPLGGGGQMPYPPGISPYEDFSATYNIGPFQGGLNSPWGGLLAMLTGQGNPGLTYLFQQALSQMPYGPQFVPVPPFNSQTVMAHPRQFLPPPQTIVPANPAYSPAPYMTNTISNANAVAGGAGSQTGSPPPYTVMPTPLFTPPTIPPYAGPAVPPPTQLAPIGAPSPTGPSMGYRPY